MSLFLASVSNVFEADVACQHGADWIDVKDPRAGALGAADVQQVADIVAQVAGRLPTSATIGDCWHDSQLIPLRSAQLAETAVDYIKAALCAERVSAVALRHLREGASMGTPLIVVCMAERAPSSAELARLLECDIAGVMLDTADKSGARLTEILSMPALRDFVRQVREAGVLCGLAGRLNVGDIERLVGLGADYLGFRGALCRDGDRNAAIDAAEVAMVASRLMHTREARKFNHSVR